MMIKRKKKCKECGNEFTPYNTIERWCSVPCAIALAEKVIAKKEKRNTYLRKQAIKSKTEWLAEAQIAFNKYVRLRDYYEPCISCGRYHGGQYHAGHYLTVKAHPALRFNENNVNKQCSACNNYLSGNIVNYRIALIKKIGLEEVEFLEGPHEPTKYQIDEIREIKTKYLKLAREIKKANSISMLGVN